MKQAMNHTMLCAKGLSLTFATSLLIGCASSGGPQALSDAAVNAEHLSYERQQDSIKTLNDSAQHRVADYSMAKAQCWLDVSFHEYSRNDRSKFPELALAESHKITHYLSEGGATDSAENPANETLLVNDAKQLRQDLWDQAARIKQHDGFQCATTQVACAEVELVHAGNEFNQQGWRHAKPYVQIAEDLIETAQAAAENCKPVAMPPVTATAEPPVEAAKPISLLVNVLFNFDKDTIGETHPSSIQRLNSIINQIQSGFYKLQDVRLVGHADKSNNTGDPNYNVFLSQRRATAVLNFLKSKGVHVGDAPVVENAGDEVQVSECDNADYTRTELEQCLLPNRRVEVHLTLLPL